METDVLDLDSVPVECGLQVNQANPIQELNITGSSIGRGRSAYHDHLEGVMADRSVDLSY